MCVYAVVVLYILFMVTWASREESHGKCQQKLKDKKHLYTIKRLTWLSSFFIVVIIS